MADVLIKHGVMVDATTRVRPAAGALSTGTPLFPLHPQAYPLWPPSLVHLRSFDTPRTQWPIPVCHFLGAAVEFEDPRPMGSLSSGESKKLARPLILCSERNV